MKAWLYHHLGTLGATLAKLTRSPVANLLNASVIGVALALPVGFHVALTNMQAFAKDLAAAPQLSLFLSREAGTGEVAAIEARLKNHPGVRRYSYVPRDEALRAIRASSGLADVIDSLERNPLPDAFVVDANAGAAQNLEALRKEFRQWPRVEHVQLDSVWAQRLDALLDLGRLATLVLGTLLAFALVAVTFNTIRLQILTQREEIEVAHLIGATHPFIRRPFLYFGTLLGLAGGIAAWGIVLTAVFLFNDRLADVSALYGVPIRLQSLSVQHSGSLLIFSAGLGWFGARLSVGQHLSYDGPG
ncbi:MAG: transporter permease [Burkholderiales bacterium]|nr:transporter permease [Burkholderiales bacterium]